MLGVANRPKRLDIPTNLQRHIPGQPHESVFEFDSKAYQRKVAEDEFDEDLEKFPWHGRYRLAGWLENYTSLFATCKQVLCEARHVLAVRLQLKISFQTRMNALPPIIGQEYLSHVQEITIMTAAAYRAMEFLQWPCTDIVAHLPNLRTLRLTAPEDHTHCRFWSSDEYLDLWGFKGGWDESLIESVRDDLVLDPDGDRMTEDTAYDCPEWFRAVLWRRQKQPFRVTIREIFNIWIDEDGEQDEASSMLRLVSLPLFLAAPD